MVSVMGRSKSKYKLGRKVMSMRHKVVFTLAVALGLSAAGLVAQEATTGASGQAPIQVTAKKYQFDPAVLKVKQGDHVKLVITATDHDHGFKLAAFNIDQHLKKGEATPVEFTADRAGTFPFECSVFCGLGHGKMKGQLIVEPSAAGSNP
jgi:cytochrome c oxidase subunit II